MDKKLNVGVVGCGQIAQISHLPYLQELPQFNISAICDLSPFVVEKLGEKFHIPNRYTDFNDLVKQENLDIVLVTNKNHTEPAIAALEQGKHVLVEKPMAFNLKLASEMLDACQRNKVKLMVGYMKRYDPAYQLMLQMMNEIEKIHLIRVHEFAGTYKINLEIYDLITASDLDPKVLESVIERDKRDMLADIAPGREDLVDAADIMLHLCIHDINALHGLYGLPEKIISAQLFDSNFVTGLMEYKNGVHLTWESGNLISLVDWDEQLTVFGSNKSLELRFPFPYLKNAATLINIRENEGASSSRRQIVTSYDEAFKREWHHFYDCIINDKEPITNGEIAKRDLEFAIELLRAAI
ncbi:MAG: Gfo/Idh/MocA family oxidoreductase [Chloroflexi bacterium]|nr:Gfo/Idh/MocA family oxidoreductase [Chloroflexota bacterium]